MAMYPIVLFLYVNRQYIGKVNDSASGAGAIGLTAENLGNSTDVAFTNAQVWTL